MAWMQSDAFIDVDQTKTLALAWLHESSNQCHQYPRTMLAKYEWDRSYNAITWLYLFPIDYYDLCIKIYASIARVHTTSWSIYFDSTHHEWLMSPAKQFQVAMVCVTKLDTYSCSMCSWTFSQIVVSVRHSWWYIWHQDWWHGSFIVGGKWPTYTWPGLIVGTRSNANTDGCRSTSSVLCI